MEIFLVSDQEIMRLYKNGIITVCISVALVTVCPSGKSELAVSG